MVSLSSDSEEIVYEGGSKNHVFRKRDNTCPSMTTPSICPPYYTHSSCTPGFKQGSSTINAIR
jgi:hypothetical protein